MKIVIELPDDALDAFGYNFNTGRLTRRGAEYTHDIEAGEVLGLIIQDALVRAMVGEGSKECDT